jgi:hypothetical protein
VRDEHVEEEGRMGLAEALRSVGEGNRGESFALLSRTLDIDWVRRALVASGTASVRKRKLPAESVAWLVIGMALLRDRSIDEVVHHLDLVMPELEQDREVSHSAIIQARERLGCEPLAMLFADTAQHWATAAADQLRWRGLAVYGVDGSTMLIADTADNELVFGRPRSGRSAGAYPQLRLVALMVLRAHLLANLVPGSYHTSEQTLAQELWKHLPERCLVVVDKGFINYAVFHLIHSAGLERHWLSRAKANLKWQIVRHMGPHDGLVRITINHSLRKKHPYLPECFYARAIGYRRRGFRPQILLTSLLDPEAYPANEIIALYHERWELEMGFDEVKTHTLERLETLRSKSPQNVLQELWGLGIAYNLVRLEMLQVARRLNLPPSRISFRHALMLIRNFLVSAWLASPGVLPKRLAALHQEVSLLVLPTRRARRYPREVKIKMSNFRKKAPPNRGTLPRWP